MAEGFSAALPRHRLRHATPQALAAVGPSQGCCHSFDTSGWEVQESLLLTPIISRSHKMRSQRLAYIPKSHSCVFEGKCFTERSRREVTRTQDSIASYVNCGNYRRALGGSNLPTPNGCPGHSQMAHQCSWTGIKHILGATPHLSIFLPPLEMWWIRISKTGTS